MIRGPAIFDAIAAFRATGLAGDIHGMFSAIDMEQWRGGDLI